MDWLFFWTCLAQVSIAAVILTILAAFFRALVFPRVSAEPEEPVCVFHGEPL